MYKTKNRYSAILQPQHNNYYPTRTNQNLNIPSHTISLFQHSLLYTGPKLWNSIPQHINLLPSLTSFKRQYKNYLLSLQ